MSTSLSFDRKRSASPHTAEPVAKKVCMCTTMDPWAVVLQLLHMWDSMDDDRHEAFDLCSFGGEKYGTMEAFIRYVVEPVAEKHGWAPVPVVRIREVLGDDYKAGNEDSDKDDAEDGDQDPDAEDGGQDQDTKPCSVCQGTKRSYWSDGIYGACLECSMDDI